MCNGLLTFNTSFKICERLTASVDAEVLNLDERNGRDGTPSLPRLGDLPVKLVDLFEGQTLGLTDAKEDEEHADETAASTDEEDLGLEICVTGTGVHHVRCGVLFKK